MTDHPLRFALQLRDAPDKTAWLDAARQAEAEGFDVVSMPDHLDGQLGPLVALGAVAAVTERVGLSMFVLANDHRHPGVLAKEITTLDRLSDGRVELGIGAGWMESEYAAVGVPFDRAGERIERLAESIAVLRGLFSQSPFTHRGRFYSITDANLYPKPVRAAGIPLVMGGGGRKMLALAAREADIVSIATNNAARTQEQQASNGTDRSVVAEQIGWLRTAAGARLPEIELNIRVLGVSINDDLSAAGAELSAALGGTPASILDSPFVFGGSQARVLEQIERNREELGITYYTVSQRHLPLVAPIIAKLAR